MKRNTTFAVTHFSAPRKIYRLVYSTLMFLMIISSSALTNAQSKDRDNPTQLTAREISGVVGDNVGETYYYSFVAGPGDLSITLTVEPVKKPFNTCAVIFELFNEDGRSIGSGYAFASNGDTRQRVERINFSRKQKVLLKIKLPVNEFETSSGKYQLQLDGPVNLSNAVSATNKSDGGDSGLDLSDLSVYDNNGGAKAQRQSASLKLEGTQFEGRVIALPGNSLLHTYYIFEKQGKVVCRFTKITFAQTTLEYKYNVVTERYEYVTGFVPGSALPFRPDEIGTYMQTGNRVRLQFSDRRLDATVKDNGLEGMVTFKESNKKEPWVVAKTPEE